MLCTTDPDKCGLKTDHVPILTHINLDVPPASDADFRNYREVNWESFNSHLSTLLSRLPLTPIETKVQFQEVAHGLDLALRETVENCVPKMKPSPHSRCWWTKDLTELKKDVNHLNCITYQFRAIPDHPSHRASKVARNCLVDEIFTAKKDHWHNWLEEMSGDDLWMAHRYINTPQSDGGCTRIPTLNVKTTEGISIMATSNKEKGELLTVEGAVPMSV